MDMDSDKLFKKTGGFTHNPVRLLEQVRQKIVHLRNCEVILDVDVARLYFPEGYMFKLTREETTCLRSKNSTANISPKSRTFPKAFTEKGLYMLATILKSRCAVDVTFAIIETFATVRQLKQELRALHNEKDSGNQQSKMQHFGEMLSSIVMPDLETSETESSLEINFLIGKIKHTVKRIKRQDSSDHTEVE